MGQKPPKDIKSAESITKNVYKELVAHFKTICVWNLDELYSERDLSKYLSSDLVETKNIVDIDDTLCDSYDVDILELNKKGEFVPKIFIKKYIADKIDNWMKDNPDFINSCNGDEITRIEKRLARWIIWKIFGTCNFNVGAKVNDKITKVVDRKLLSQFLNNVLNKNGKVSSVTDSTKRKELARTIVLEICTIDISLFMNDIYKAITHEHKNKDGVDIEADKPSTTYSKVTPSAPSKADIDEVHKPVKTKDGIKVSPNTAIGLSAVITMSTPIINTNVVHDIVKPIMSEEPDIVKCPPPPPYDESNVDIVKCPPPPYSVVDDSIKPDKAEEKPDKAEETNPESDSLYSEVVME
jgi:hypothetical protein